MVNVEGSRPTGWLVRPDDVDALADALAAVIEQPGELRERGLNARAHAVTSLSWAGRVAAFEAAYEAASATAGAARAARAVRSAGPAPSGSS
jgi:glycosyltransferase involved in cell wall biosynthesis